MKYLKELNEEYAARNSDNKRDAYLEFIKREFLAWNIVPDKELLESLENPDTDEKSGVLSFPLQQKESIERFRKILRDFSPVGKHEKEDLENLERKIDEALKNSGKTRAKVILIGHSQGCLFIERLFQKRKDIRNRVHVIVLASPYLNPSVRQEFPRRSLLANIKFQQM